MSRKARRVGQPGRRQRVLPAAPAPRPAPPPARTSPEPPAGTAEKIERDVGGALSAIWNVVSADCPEQVLAKEIARKFRK